MLAIKFVVFLISFFSAFLIGIAVHHTFGWVGLPLSIIAGLAIGDVVARFIYIE